jgi:hypothetical protein
MRRYQLGREPQGSLYVGRPTPWGNPFTVEEYGREVCLMKYRIWLQEQLAKQPNFLEPLRGKNLVCFCKLHEACHADILIEFLAGGESKREPQTKLL